MGLGILAALNPTTAIGSVVGGFDSLASVWGQRYQNRSNIEQGEIARDYQTRMSNTSYQRAVADMEAAGLNPMLAAGSPASTPGTSATRVESPVSGVGLAGALQAMKLLAEIDETDARKEVARASIPKVVADGRQSISSANALDAFLEKQGRLLGLEVKHKEAGSPYWSSNAEAEANILLRREGVENARERISEDEANYSRHTLPSRVGATLADAQVRKGTAEAEIRQAIADATIRELDLPGARQEAGAWSGPFGSKRPYLRDAAGVASTFSSAGHAYRSFRR